ncbi:hypothetical protein AB1Y20_022469 [Prymnesium parvum]|uniref:Uncharacterized protein n=1 Tax=Prymnesium parvum TaxID=97485 RepID=A0AB34JHA6_PRYPA
MADEFAGRDAMGLQKDQKPQSEAEARASYFRLFSKLIGLQAPLLCWSIYAVSVYLLPGGDVVAAKLAFIHRYSLGSIFAAWFAVYLVRIYASINANGARAPVRLDRPDQHVYKIMARDGPLVDAPYVMMASTGAAGRFNRAQRAAFNMDESLPTSLTGLLLQTCVFGAVGLFPALLYAYGAAKFCDAYKESSGARSSGFMPRVIAESLSAGMVGVCAIKGMMGPLVPF